MSKRIGLIAVIVCVAMVALPNDAFAYVDPGAGSVVLQILFAAVLGAALTVRQWWAKAISLARTVLRRKPG